MDPVDDHVELDQQRIFEVRRTFFGHGFSKVLDRGLHFFDLVSSLYDVDVVLRDGFLEPSLLLWRKGLEVGVGLVFALGLDRPVEQSLPVHLELIVGEGFDLVGLTEIGRAHV